MSEEKYGRIVQIIGPVIDVAFDDLNHWYLVFGCEFVIALVV